MRSFHQQLPGANHGSFVESVLLSFTAITPARSRPFAAPIGCQDGAEWAPPPSWRRSPDFYQSRLAHVPTL